MKAKKKLNRGEYVSKLLNTSKLNKKNYYYPAGKTITAFLQSWHLGRGGGGGETE